MQQWDFLIAGMNLPRANLYQLRHGGAAHDYLTKKRPLLEVMARGRWSSTSTFLRYAKAGKVQKLVKGLDQASLAFAVWSERNLQKVLHGRAAPRPPFSLAAFAPASRRRTRPRRASALLDARQATASGSATGRGTKRRRRSA